MTDLFLRVCALSLRDGRWGKPYFSSFVPAKSKIMEHVLISDFQNRYSGVATLV